MSSSETTTPVSLRTYIVTYVGLLLLATLSLALSQHHDSFALFIALAIGAIKAVLVLLFFMHLIEETFTFRFIMVISTVLVGILISLTVLDPMTRNPYPPAPSKNPTYQVLKAR